MHYALTSWTTTITALHFIVTRDVFFFSMLLAMEIKHPSNHQKCGCATKCGIVAYIHIGNAVMHHGDVEPSISNYNGRGREGRNMIHM